MPKTKRKSKKIIESNKSLISLLILFISFPSHIRKTTTIQYIFATLKKCEWKVSESNLPSTDLIILYFLDFFKFCIERVLFISYNYYRCGYSSVAESHASDLVTRVQFPLPTPYSLFLLFFIKFYYFLLFLKKACF